MKTMYAIAGLGLLISAPLVVNAVVTRGPTPPTPSTMGERMRARVGEMAATARETMGKEATHVRLRMLASELKRKFEGMNDAQRAQVKERVKNAAEMLREKVATMSDAQREALREKLENLGSAMKERWENMTPDQQKQVKEQAREAARAIKEAIGEKRMMPMRRTR